MSAKCLYCYKPLTASQNVSQSQDFHTVCSKKIFGLPEPPVLPYNNEEFERLAAEAIKSQTTLTGVQAKLSLHIAEGDGSGAAKKFTIVGLWGGYILKPASLHYPFLPETEDLTMHLAAIAGIQTVPHSLIRLSSGSLAYITKRIDRAGKRKFHMEDMCQITEKLTEHKYRGSYEQVAKAINRYSANPGLDLVNYFELLLFCFLTGNSDMHLKNFSLLQQPPLGMVLSPAYDLVAVALVNPADDEDLALTLNGKKKKIKMADFTAVFDSFGMEAKQQDNIFGKMQKAKAKWLAFIDSSFLSEDFKDAYKALIEERFNRLS